MSFSAKQLYYAFFSVDEVLIFYFFSLDNESESSGVESIFQG